MSDPRTTTSDEKSGAPAASEGSPLGSPTPPKDPDELRTRVVAALWRLLGPRTRWLVSIVVGMGVLAAGIMGFLKNARDLLPSPEPTPSMRLEVTPYYHQPYGYAYWLEESTLRRAEAMPALAQEMHTSLYRSDRPAAEEIRAGYRVSHIDSGATQITDVRTELRARSTDLPARYVLMWMPKGYAAASSTEIALRRSVTRYEVTSPDHVLSLAPNDPAVVILARIVDAEPGIYSMSFSARFGAPSVDGSMFVTPNAERDIRLFAPCRADGCRRGVSITAVPSSPRLQERLARRILALGDDEYARLADATRELPLEVLRQHSHRLEAWIGIDGDGGFVDAILGAHASAAEPEPSPGTIASVCATPGANPAVDGLCAQGDVAQGEYNRALERLGHAIAEDPLVEDNQATRVAALLEAGEVNLAEHALGEMPEELLDAPFAVVARLLIDVRRAPGRLKELARTAIRNHPDSDRMTNVVIRLAVEGQRPDLVIETIRARCTQQRPGAGHAIRTALEDLSRQARESDRQALNKLLRVCDRETSWSISATPGLWHLLSPSRRFSPERRVPPSDVIAYLRALIGTGHMVAAATYGPDLVESLAAVDEEQGRLAYELLGEAFGHEGDDQRAAFAYLLSLGELADGTPEHEARTIKAAISLYLTRDGDLLRELINHQMQSVAAQARQSPQWREGMIVPMSRSSAVASVLQVLLAPNREQIAAAILNLGVADPLSPQAVGMGVAMLDETIGLLRELQNPEYEADGALEQYLRSVRDNFMLERVCCYQDLQRVQDALLNAPEPGSFAAASMLYEGLRVLGEREPVIVRVEDTFAASVIIDGVRVVSGGRRQPAVIQALDDWAQGATESRDRASAPRPQILQPAQMFGEAYAQSGMRLYHFDMNVRDSVTELERAVELDPTNARALLQLALVRAVRGESCLDELTRARMVPRVESDYPALDTICRLRR